MKRTLKQYVKQNKGIIALNFVISVIFVYVWKGIPIYAEFDDIWYLLGAITPFILIIFIGITLFEFGIWKQKKANQ